MKEVIQELFFHCRDGEVPWARRCRSIPGLGESSTREIGAPVQGACSAEPCPGRRAGLKPAEPLAEVEED